MTVKIIKNIIWDLSGTLFRPTIKNLRSKKGGVHRPPNFSLLLYLWSGKKTTNKYDKIAIDILTKTIQSSEERTKILLHTGKPVPEIICLWLSGIINYKQAYKKTLDSYKKTMLKTSGQGRAPHVHNLSNHEKLLIKNMLSTLFNPKALANAMRPVIPMVNILRKCSNPKYKFFILSNWDLESFDILYQTKKGQKVFQYFNKKNIVISGQTGYMKPQKEIYKYFLKKTKINPAESLFIDDQLENLQAAEKFGIIPIHYQNNNEKKVLNRLKRYKIIK